MSTRIITVASHTPDKTPCRHAIARRGADSIRTRTFQLERVIASPQAAG